MPASNYIGQQWIISLIQGITKYILFNLWQIFLQILLRYKAYSYSLQARSA
jgi:hypothetical protein